MISFRIAAGCALAAVLVASSPSPALKLRANSSTAHHVHLRQALHHLKEAHREIHGNRAGEAHHHISAAIREVTEAATHHHKNNLSKPQTGLSGALSTAVHHKHHSHLQQALKDMNKAEQQLRTGHTGKSAHDVTAAERQIHDALRTHKS
jgi:hypothetical protein